MICQIESLSFIPQSSNIGLAALSRFATNKRAVSGQRLRWFPSSRLFNCINRKCALRTLDCSRQPTYYFLRLLVPPYAARFSAISVRERAHRGNTRQRNMGHFAPFVLPFQCLLLVMVRDTGIFPAPAVTQT